jgi:hypothetical protein
VWVLRDRLSDRVLLPDLAEELGVRYHELYQTCRRIGLELDRHPTSRQFEISVEAGQLLREEHARVRALHQRSMKMAEAARRLKLAVSTIGLIAKRGQLEVDPQTDGSGARFVTRASVERWAGRADDPQQQAPEVEAVPLADVIRFTGRGRVELGDLVRAGILEEVPGRGRVELTAASLRSWRTTGI